jgi:hypothetical protein
LKFKSRKVGEDENQPAIQAMNGVKRRLWRPAGRPYINSQAGTPALPAEGARFAKGECRYTGPPEADATRLFNPII